MKQSCELPIRALITDQEGATAIEYALLAALIAVAIMTALQGLGNEVGATFTGVKDTMASSNTTAA